MLPAEPASIHPDCVSTLRTVRVGGVSKLELLASLQTHGIELNRAGRTLFALDAFKTAETGARVPIVEIAVADLGFAQGATIARIHQRSAELGLSLCPLELAPHLRLQYPDQPEGDWGHPPSRHRAPPGSITVASPQLSDDDDVPKGFYLRRIKGVLWLRGYRSGAAHIWSPDDHFVFRRPDAAATWVGK
jgi:hypothetical protein